jgi:homoserine O-succinyltransferase/O-acetyltransferase
MPVTIDRPAVSSNTRVSDIFSGRRRGGSIGDSGRRIKIGLVNNMPDSALAATERQFCGVLEAASGKIEVQLRLYALGQVQRSHEAQERLAQRYADAGALRGQSLDALIVTGAQPLAPDLEQEPYWRALTSLIDWAEANTTSTILSCLAAHAGVLHFSGIARRRLPAKRSGVFAFEVAQGQGLTAGAGRQWLMPHSRYNDLDEAELTRNGYTVLARSAAAGVDMFTRRTRSLFVFLQGHPEYDGDTLAREFRRDMSRYLNSELETPPHLPQDYFSDESERVLTSFQARARSERAAETMAWFPEVWARGATDAPWRRPASLFYRNWLRYVAERKTELLQNAAAPAARWGG